MNKKEKEKKVANFEAYILTEQIAQIADTIAFETHHQLYTEINEHIFDRNLAKESDDKRYGPIFEEVYNTVITRLNNLTFND